MGTKRNVARAVSAKTLNVMTVITGSKLGKIRNVCFDVGHKGQSFTVHIDGEGNISSRLNGQKSHFQD